MTLTEFFSKMKLSPKDAEVIFDRDEPIGRPTDLVMPRRRWLRRSKTAAKAAKQASQTHSQTS